MMAITTSSSISVKAENRGRLGVFGLGGTGHWPVLGGNLPPSRTPDGRPPFSARVVRAVVGRVARQNGPVARSTRNPTEWFRFGLYRAATPD